MATHAFLTVDTELVWRHHAAGLTAAEVFERSLEPAGLGVGWQLARLAEHGLKATFFVDPMPARIYGIEPIERVVGAIQGAGQEVQLHLHPNWTKACTRDRSRSDRFELNQYPAAEQRALLEQAIAVLMAAGAPRPIAFRAGSYAADDDKLIALKQLGIRYDSSHNGSDAPWPSQIGLAAQQIAPVARHGVIEVPVTVIEEAPGVLRHFQICALSVAEMRAALDHAIVNDHVAVTIVSHGFELANRAGTHPNAVHVRRFDMLCHALAARRGQLATTHYRDLTELPLGRPDRPLEASRWRTQWRRAEQLWSNMVAERGA